MTNKYSTKKALIASLLVLALCFSTFVGTTFAWFTDSVTSANNIIMSGNLDIKLEYWDGDSWEDIAGKSDILTNKLWEPGAVEVAYLRVANAGSLALKYQLGVNIVSETGGINVAGEEFLLSDYIMFGVDDEITVDASGNPSAYADRDTAVAAVTGAKKISAGYTKSSSMVAGADALYLALVVWMPEEVGNVANHKTGTAAPKIDLGINVVATQVANEEDSFGSDYDADVTVPNVAFSSTVIAPDSDTVIIVDDVQEEVVSYVKAIVPANSAKKEGATNLTLVITTLENEPSGVVIEGGQGFYAYDVEVVGLDENAPQAVEMVWQLEAGISVSNLYHYDEEIDFTYDPNTGILTFVANGFSPYTIVFDDSWDGSVDTTWYNDVDNSFVLTDPAQLAGVSALAESGNTFGGKTIILGADMYLGGNVWTAIKQFSGTFDGNGYSINDFHIDASTGHSAFIYKTASNNGVTPAVVKNLTLSDITANVGKNCRVAALVVSYNKTDIENVTVKNFAVTATGSTSWIAGLACAGTVNSEVTLNDCTVENFTVNDAYGAQFISGITAVMQRNGNEAEDTNVLYNLQVKNFVVNVNGIVANGASTAVGGLIGQTQSVWQNPHFKNCSVTGLDVTATGRVDVGGFMAHPGSYTYTTDCSVDGKIDVSGVTSAANYAGGFYGDYGWGDNVGKGDHKATDCIADVDIVTNVAAAGGFVGAGINTENRNKNITLTNCEAKGTVTLVEGGTACIGGFVGKTDRGIYVNCTAAQESFIGQVMDGYTLTDDGNGTLTVAK